MSYSLEIANPRDPSIRDPLIRDPLNTDTHGLKVYIAVSLNEVTIPVTTF